MDRKQFINTDVYQKDREKYNCDTFPSEQNMTEKYCKYLFYSWNYFSSLTVSFKEQRLKFSVME